jgi:hypothetical protein
MRNPIKVNPIRKGDKIHPMSRLHLTKISTVEHNVKIYHFGNVDKDHVWLLETQFWAALSEEFDVDIFPNRNPPHRAPNSNPPHRAPNPNPPHRAPNPNRPPKSERPGAKPTSGRRRRDTVISKTSIQSSEDHATSRKAEGTDSAYIVEKQTEQPAYSSSIHNQTHVGNQNCTANPGYAWTPSQYAQSTANYAYSANYNYSQPQQQQNDKNAQYYQNNAGNYANNQTQPSMLYYSNYGSNQQVSSQIQQAQVWSTNQANQTQENDETNTEE